MSRHIGSTSDHQYSRYDLASRVAKGSVWKIESAIYFGEKRRSQNTWPADRAVLKIDIRSKTEGTRERVLRAVGRIVEKVTLICDYHILSPHPPHA